MPAYAAQPHAVGGQFGDFGLGDVGHHVGREVGRRVVHLVEQLLLHGVGVDAPAGACGFGDGAVAVCVDLGDGVPQRGQAGHVFVAGVGVITTRHLGATFEQVARHGGAGDARPVVARPAKVGQRRAHRQRGVGHPAADHDVGTGQQGIGNGLGAQVGVGRHHVQPVQSRAQRLLQQRALVGRTQVVTLHHGNAGCGQAQRGRQGVDTACSGFGVGRAKVAHDTDAALQAARQHRAQHVVQQRLVTRVGVGAAGQLGQGQCALGQRLEDQKGRPACGEQRVHHRAGRVGAVPRKTSGAANTQDVVVHRSPCRECGTPPCACGASPSRGRTQWPGGASSTGALEGGRADA